MVFFSLYDRIQWIVGECQKATTKADPSFFTQIRVNRAAPGVPTKWILNGGESRIP
jgi:hypothetical protein